MRLKIDSTLQREHTELFLLWMMLVDLTRFKHHGTFENAFCVDGRKTTDTHSHGCFKPKKQNK